MYTHFLKILPAAFVAVTNTSLTLSPPNTIKVPYANSLDPDETPSGSKLFDIQTTFSPTLSKTKAP